jgi:hypothetical protein
VSVDPVLQVLANFIVGVGNDWFINDQATALMGSEMQIYNKYGCSSLHHGSDDPRGAPSWMESPSLRELAHQDAEVAACSLF